MEPLRTPIEEPAEPAGIFLQETISIIPLDFNVLIGAGRRIKELQKLYPDNQVDVKVEQDTQDGELVQNDLVIQIRQAA